MNPNVAIAPQRVALKDTEVVPMLMRKILDDRCSTKAPHRRQSAPRYNNGGSRRPVSGNKRDYDTAMRNINKEILRLGRDRDWKGILDLCESQEHEYNNVNYATTMNQLGKIQSVNLGDASVIKFIDDVWDILDTRGLGWMGIRQTANIVHAIGKMHIGTYSACRIVEFIASKDNARIFVESGSPQDVANVCWSLAKLGRSDIASPLLHELEKHANKIVVDGKPQEISNTAWAYAKLGVQSSKLFALIDKHADKIVVEGRPQAVSNTAWSCATLGVQSPKLFAEIGKHATKLVAEATPQQNANIAWSYTTLGVRSPKFFAEIEKHADKLVGEGKPQEIANTAWACATLGIQSPNLFAAMDKHAHKIVTVGNAQAIANSAWSCATLGVQSPKLFAEMEKHASKLVVQGSPQSIANTAVSCAKLGVQSPKLFAEIEKHANRFVVEADPQNIANTAWSCATLGVRSPKLFAAIDKHSVKFVAKATPQNIANTAWSFATLGVNAPKFFAQVKRHASKLTVDGKAQDLTNSLWACIITSRVEGENTDLVLLLWEAVLKRNPVEFAKEGLRQLAQILAFSAVLEGIDLPKPPAEMLKRIRSACVNSGTIESLSQKQVSKILTALGLNVKDEASPSSQLEFLDSVLKIDMIVPENMLAIEFDGPTHYLRSVKSEKRTRTEDGPTQAKRRFLEKLGWKVMKIDYRDWENVGTSKHARIRFLRKQLAEVGVQV